MIGCDAELPQAFSRIEKRSSTSEQRPKKNTVVFPFPLTFGNAAIRT